MNIDQLKVLSDAYGISSCEESVSQLVLNHAKEHALETLRDGLGSVIEIAPGTYEGFSIMLAAHMDEVGFMVKEIDEAGFIRLEMVGSIWLHMILGQQFAVVTRAGNVLRGVIGSRASHGIPQDVKQRVVELDEVYLDLGVSSRDRVLDLGVSIGDMVVPWSNFTALNDVDVYQGKALDDRYGVACIMEAMQWASSELLHAKIYGAYTTMEEPGLRGARSATAEVSPSVAIAVDTTVAGDTPLDRNRVKLGGGVVISMLDSNTIYHRRFMRYVESLCKQHGIPHQYSVFDKGGTDAGNIHKINEGALTITLSLPIRYMHTNVSIVNTRDGDALIKLLKVLLSDLTYEKYRELEGLS